MPDNDLPLMLQSLPENQFRLKAHRERKESRAYALVVARNGPKFQPSGDHECLANQKTVPGCGGLRFSGLGLTAEAVSMPALVRALAGIVGISVLDETGLKKVYDFKLEFMDNNDGTGLSTNLLAALQPQLGLRLEAKKSVIPVLVIDRTEKPQQINLPGGVCGEASEAGIQKPLAIR